APAFQADQDRSVPLGFLPQLRAVLGRTAPAFRAGHVEPASSPQETRGPLRPDSFAARVRACVGRTAPAFQADQDRSVPLGFLPQLRAVLGRTAPAFRARPAGLYDADLTGVGPTRPARRDTEAAERHFRQAVDLYGNTGSSLGQATATLSLGELAHVRSDYGTAERHYLHALDLYQKTGSSLGQATATLGQATATLGQATATLGLGELARARSDIDTAEQHFRHALDLYQKTGSSLGQATATLGLGELARARSYIDTAEQHLTNDERAMLSLMDRKDRARYLLQRRIDEKREMSVLLSQLQALRHQTAMAVINNIR
ncbi:tetratricopeptide repeat protein, partial [Streptomyces sp. NPDC058759]|uniref:tetratricopeptide repeat protein n=1 Tax=Streptomyces sp. NPDC058759 TaxID=3346628 RepID=UPI00369AF365